MDEEKAIAFWEKYKNNFSPLLLLYTKNKILFLDANPLFDATPETRHTVTTLITERIVKMIGEPLEKVFLLSEAWLSQPAKGTKEFVRPSEDPKRQEVLLIHSKDKDRNLQMLTIPIIQMGKERKLDLTKKMYTTKGYTHILDAFFAGSSAATN